MALVPVILATLVSLSAFAQSQQEPPSLPVIREPVTAVPFVDLEKVTGRWYEIATIPDRFSEGCNCTVVDYKLNEDSSLKVETSCRMNNPAGKLVTSRGRSTSEDKTNAKLKTHFFLSWFPGVRNISSREYWITALGENYEYTVMANKKGSSMWILSREPFMDEEVLENIISASRKSIDVSKLRMQNHRGCSYPDPKL